jgi:hypothetical protein
MRPIQIAAVIGMIAWSAVSARSEEPASPSGDEIKNAVARALAYVDAGKVTMDGVPLTRADLDLESADVSDRVLQDILVRLKIKSTETPMAGLPPGKPLPHVSIEFTFDKTGRFLGAGVGMPAGLKKEPVIRFVDENKKPE